MNRVESVGGPLQRLTLEFEPVDPNTPPAVPGPLEVVSAPLERFELSFEPVNESCGIDLDQDEVRQATEQLAKLVKLRVKIEEIEDV